MLSYSYSHRIAWGECDSAGIVFYPNFYRWFDQGSHELVRKAGHTVLSMRQQGHDILLVETGCTYRANERPSCPPTEGVHLEFLGLIVDRCRGTVAAKRKWVVDL